MSPVHVLLALAGAWFAGALVLQLFILPWLARGPGRDPVVGLLWQAARLYVRLWHRPVVVGAHHLPRDDDDHDGLIVVANHACAVDPLIVQASCPFLIRWMMAEDMMGPQLDWLWRDELIIPVDRLGRDTASLREAIRHVRAGGAVGVFPEGRITMPPRELRPFLPGVGLLVSRTRAPVLLAWITGTPETNKMGEALATRSRSRVEFIDLIEPDDERDATVIAERLRRRLAEVSGWPLNEETLPAGGAEGRGRGTEGPRG